MTEYFMKNLQTRDVATGSASKARAVARDFASIGGEDLNAILNKLLEDSKSVAQANDNLQSALSLIADLPLDPQGRSMLLQIQEKARQPDGLAEGWAELFEVIPDDPVVLRFHLLSLSRASEHEAALALLDKQLPKRARRMDTLFLRARLLDDLGEHESSGALFAKLIERHDDRPEIRVEFAKRLFKRGLVIEAHDVIASVDTKNFPRAAGISKTVIGAHDCITRYEKRSALVGKDFRLFAMKHAILRFRDRPVKRLATGPLEGAMLFTGSLGPGGAERQMTRLACHLHRDWVGEGKRVAGPIDVVVKSHRKSAEAAFFLPDLVECQVPVHELEERKPVAPKEAGHIDAETLELLGHLPPQVHYGVVRLLPLIEEHPRELLSLWQDGACLIGGLAGLLAGVPRVQLMFRGLPPNIRRERYKPEYYVAYRALAEIPGVQFVTNSHAAAKAYAEWLDIPEDRFDVLHNGVPPLDTDASAEAEQRWNEFDKATADATETIGGVFRFESDKQPSRWIDLAHHYLRRRPTARFVVVGNGRLFDTAKERAATYGIEDRILFVGHSPFIGFWYSKMDVKVLLSRFEGLPNVLIEAQYLGVPVVTTPAGGSAETIMENESGIVLSSTEIVDYAEACDGIEQLIGQKQKAVTAMASHVRTKFSLTQFLDNFVSLAVSEGSEPVIAKA